MFQELTDPRRDLHKKNKLSDMFFITLCAVICGANNCVTIDAPGCRKSCLLQLTRQYA
ncbi:MAG: transposase family protein [Methylococcales bacterium]|nr:transposase family protein [Methylococcales bacterium]